MTRASNVPARVATNSSQPWPTARRSAGESGRLTRAVGIPPSTHEQGLFPDRCQIRQASAYDAMSFDVELHWLLASSCRLNFDAVEDVAVPRI
jgi:hypothetical protein